ncbi:hypothetical protein BDW75DRAFT_128692 [Aspergillus navahoensis]
MARFAPSRALGAKISLPPVRSSPDSHLPYHQSIRVSACMQLQGGSNEATGRFSLLYYHTGAENDDYCILLYLRLILLLIAAIITTTALLCIYLLPATQRPSFLLLHSPHSKVLCPEIWVPLSTLSSCIARSLILASHRSRHNITTNQLPRLIFLSSLSFLFLACSPSRCFFPLRLDQPDPLIFPCRI